MIKTILFLLLLSFQVFAECPNTRNELVERTIQGLDTEADWECFFVTRQDERDSLKSTADYTNLFPIMTTETRTINGTIKYMGFLKKKYNYDVQLDKETNNITVVLRIHTYPSKAVLKRIKNGTHLSSQVKSVEDLHFKVTTNIKCAEETWNKNLPENIKFRFIKVDNKKEAHYSLKLSNMMTAIYDKLITDVADPFVWAHEIGHMLGLDEEYVMATNLGIGDFLSDVPSINEVIKRRNYNTKSLKCNIDSIMCLENSIMPYHLNRILGRL